MTAEAAPTDARMTTLARAAADEGVIRRFWGHVVITDGCWWWTGAISAGGHGRFWVQRGLVVIAHRFAWLTCHPGQELPNVLAHDCDNALCQRPAHLQPSDQGANRRDWSARRRTPGSPLRDTRGARERALAVRAALGSGTSLHDAIAAGRPGVDVGQGVLWTDSLE
jgi:hypothetical protein